MLFVVHRNQRRYKLLSGRLARGNAREDMRLRPACTKETGDGCGVLRGVVGTSQQRRMNVDFYIAVLERGA